MSTLYQQLQSQGGQQSTDISSKQMPVNLQKMFEVTDKANENLLLDDDRDLDNLLDVI